MNLVVTVFLWAGIGVGVVILTAGIRGRALLVDLATLRRSGEERWRFAAAGVAGVVVLVVTGWIAAALLTAAGIWVLPKLVGGRAANEAAVARTEAIAAWTEMVRDSMVAASGLEEAIAATGPVAPEPIDPEVRRLVHRLDPHAGVPLPDALAAFGADVHHPSADLVVAALQLAARMEVADLTSLLSRLAEAIRDDARMRIRIDVGRTRIRTAAKVIVVVVAATVVLLAMTNLDYLSV
jgi:tight adherence protein B